MRIRHSLAMTVTALALAAAVAACGGTTAKVGAGSTVKGQPERGGTVTVAEPSGASPNDIFPLPPATNTNGYNVNLTDGRVARAWSTSEMARSRWSTRRRACTAR